MILAKKILGAFVRYGWTAIFAAPVVMKILGAVLDPETILELKRLGEPGGAIDSWLWITIMGLAPLAWSVWAKAIEVAKRWIAAHMPSTSLPKAEAAAASYSQVEKLKIAIGQYPSNVTRVPKDAA